MMFYNRCLFFI